MFTTSHNTIRSRGFSMIELLVAVLIVSVGLLGIAGLQALGLRNNHSAYMRSQATILAYDGVDMLRADKDRATTGSYDTALGTAPPSCSGAVSCGLNNWLTQLQTLLPNGTGSIAVAGNDTATIIVQWIDDRDDPQAPPQQFQFEARL